MDNYRFNKYLDALRKAKERGIQNLILKDAPREQISNKMSFSEISKAIDLIELSKEDTTKDLEIPSQECANLVQSMTTL